MDNGVWRTRDRSLLGGGLALGLAAVVIAWYRSGRTADGGQQLAWLEIGVVAVVTTAFTAALWIRSGRRAVCRRRARVLGELAVGAEVAVAAPSGDAEAALLLATPRGGRYHRASCALVAGRVALPAEPDAHRAAGRVACEVCRP
jgi:uncharacterized protein (DUF2237 family)